MSWSNPIVTEEEAKAEAGEGPAEFAAVTICGSMRYYQVMLKAAEEASRQGWMVYMPFVACEENEEGLKEMLDEMHFCKIRNSWAILVVGRHRGESTKGEIQYALDRKKTVLEFHANQDHIAPMLPGTWSGR